jgi:hypothetical protein
MDTATAIPNDRYYYLFEDPSESNIVAEIPQDEIVLSNIDEYASQPTKRQRRFDWIMGVFLPLVCFYFDPIVFAQWSGADAMLSGYKVPAYITAFSAIMAHSAWLLWGERMGEFRYLVAFILYFAAASAIVIGAIIFPVSLLGILFIFVGLLGFTPFFTAKVYLRSANQAMFPGKNEAV